MTAEKLLRGDEIRIIEMRVSIPRADQRFSGRDQQYLETRRVRMNVWCGDF
jgi:hypothetical protein